MITLSESIVLFALLLLGIGFLGGWICGYFHYRNRAEAERLLWRDRIGS